jgi:hypothetical protein
VDYIVVGVLSARNCRGFSVRNMCCEEIKFWSVRGSIVLVLVV